MWAERENKEEEMMININERIDDVHLKVAENRRRRQPVIWL